MFKFILKRIEAPSAPLFQLQLRKLVGSLSLSSRDAEAIGCLQLTLHSLTSVVLPKPVGQRKHYSGVYTFLFNIFYATLNKLQGESYSSTTRLLNKQNIDKDWKEIGNKMRKRLKLNKIW
jgi:hypothetical protein